jgi:hypothetical protein
MKGVLGDELAEFVKLAEITDELIIKLYAVLGEIVFWLEKFSIRGVKPVIAFVDDYIGKRKEAFAISYRNSNNIEVIHVSGIKFYTPFVVDPNTTSLQELYERLFSDPAVKDAVLKIAVIEFAMLLRNSLQELREKVFLENSIYNLKYVIEKSKDPVILDEAKLLLAEAVVTMDALSKIREEMDSLIERLEHVDALNQLEDVIRSLDRIISDLKDKEHLVDKVKPIAKKAKILDEFIEEFADIIEKIKKEARKQCREEESEEEY